MANNQSPIERKAEVKLNRYFSTVIEFNDLKAGEREPYLAMLVEGGIDAWSLPVKHDQAIMLMYIYLSVEPTGGRNIQYFNILRPIR